jgi:serine/threonine-protein kinase
VSEERPSVERIFAAAASLSVNARGALLETQCAGDNSLRREVESLLAEHDAGAAFLESPPNKLIGAGLSADSPDQKLGAYRLVRLLGQGGMGAVYLAEQEEPVRRQVALKLLAAGWTGSGGRDVLARFEAERQTLAMLDHPGVARVLDAGVARGGQPFFVMDLVDGRAITEVCRERSLSIEVRVELMIAVCEAVHHAHQKGIIHRDLKPGNILVEVASEGSVDRESVHRGQLRPRIIDFGIAKVIGDAARNRTAMTEAGSMLGTLEYMSPEQAGGAAAGVDIRADVYSLGMVLYEVLVGVPALDGRSLRMSGLEGMLRVLRTVDPARPSERAAGSGRAAAALSRRLRGDLDWIVMRAIEKDRERRYASTLELADDLRRHLRHRPVRACPPGTLYVLGRFVRRRRGVVGAIGAVIASLALGLGAAVHSYRDARRAEDLANARYSTMLTTMARLSDSTSSTLANVAGGSRAAAVVADTALSQMRELGARGDSDPVWEQAIAYALQRVGECRLVMGPTPEALELFEESLLVREHSARAHPQDSALERSLGVGYLKLAEAQLQLGRASEALEANRRALATFEGMAEAIGPGITERAVYLGRGHRSVGESLARLGRPDEALLEFQTAMEWYRRGLEAQGDNNVLLRGRAATLRDIADALAMTPRAREAREAYGTAVEAGMAVSGVMGPSNVSERASLVRCRIGLSDVLVTLGEREAALAEAERALEVAAALAGADPDHAESRLLLAEARLAEAKAHDASGRTNHARAAAALAAEHLRTLCIADPHHAGAAAALARAERLTEQQR